LKSLLQSRAGVVGAMTTSRGISQDLEREAENMAKRQPFLHRKGNI
jgi:hypothetical protein